MSKQSKIDKNEKLKELAKETGTSIKIIKKCTIYLAKASCGCCTEELYFLSDESAQQAFQAVGLGSSQEIVDDIGKTHTQIDTFYGLLRV